MSTPFFRFFDKFSEVNLRAKHFSRKLTKKLAPRVCAVGLRGGQFLRAVGFAVDRYIGFPTVSGDFDIDFILVHSCIELLITTYPLRP